MPKKHTSVSSLLNKKMSGSGHTARAVWVVFRLYRHQQIVAGVFQTSAKAQRFRLSANRKMFGAQHYTLCCELLGEQVSSVTRSKKVFIVTDNADPFHRGFYFKIYGTLNEGLADRRTAQACLPNRWVRLEAWPLREAGPLQRVEGKSGVLTLRGAIPDVVPASVITAGPPNNSLSASAVDVSIRWDQAEWSATDSGRGVNKNRFRGFFVTRRGVAAAFLPAAQATAAPMTVSHHQRQRHPGPKRSAGSADKIEDAFVLFRRYQRQFIAAGVFASYDDMMSFRQLCEQVSIDASYYAVPFAVVTDKGIQNHEDKEVFLVTANGDFSRGETFLMVHGSFESAQKSILHNREPTEGLTMRIEVWPMRGELMPQSLSKEPPAASPFSFFSDPN